MAHKCIWTSWPISSVPALGLVLLMTASGYSALEPNIPETACIATPHEYRQAWDHYQADCVSPRLFGTIHPSSQDSLYPKGFWYAWAGAHNNLEMFLQLNKTYGDSTKASYNPNKVRAGILTIMGFASIDTNAYNLAVYALSEDEQVLVPTFETWFGLLERELGWTYPLSAQKDLIFAYSWLSPARNVVNVYSELSGCSYADLIADQAGPGPYKSCNHWYNAAIEQAVCSPYTSGCESRTCFENFFEHYEGPRNAAAIRGALAQCQDVSQWNTGMGIGFSTLPNPFVCKPANEQLTAEHYTGREVILRNRPLSQLDHIDLPLAYHPDIDQDFLVDGYCH